jgi:DNA-binding beta-propeller fold protein YncE
MSRFLATAATAALLVLASVAAASGMAGSSPGGSSPHNNQRGLIHLDGSPSQPAVNPRTHTLYVPIQCDHTNSCPGKPTGHLLDIVDTSRCHHGVSVGCRVVGRAPGGEGPLAPVIDERTGTIYVVDGAGAVTVLDGARCNATVRTRCGALAKIRIGGFDVAGALNPRTHTLYVVDLNGHVFVVNVARCNSHTTRGCHQRVRKVSDPRGPDGIDVDLASNTVYVADSGPGGAGSGHTVSVISGATCNGSAGAGCQRKPRTVGVGANPYWLTVDQATDTVYVANHDDGTVSVLNGAACNGTVTSGCHRTPRTVVTGGNVAWVEVDQSRHTLFALNDGDGTMSAINTRTCNGHRTMRCPRRARNERVPFNPPTGGNANAFALLPGSGTAFVANAGGEAFLAAISINRCDAKTTVGCRVEAPSAPLDLAFPEIDPATDTIYASNADKPGIEVVNGATCRPNHWAGCAPVATIPFAHPQANLGSIDHSTETLYAADAFADTVWAIDIRHCNAHDTTGCSAPAPKIKVGLYPSNPTLNPATHTLYLPQGKHHSDQVGVIDASTCNAQDHSGCGQTPAVIHVGPNTYWLGVSAPTNTVYAVSAGSNFDGHTVWVVNGATCNATDHSGCSSDVVAKAKVGLLPVGVLVDDAAHTVYVINNAQGDDPGTLSLINSATCNGTKTTSCSSTKPTVTVGRSPIGIAINPGTGRVYVADFSSAAVSMFNSSRCNAGHPGGCRRPAHEQAVGSEPGFVLVNPEKRTVYVTTHDLATGGFAWSFLPASPQNGVRPAG